MNCMIYLMLKIENFNFKMRFFSFFFYERNKKGKKRRNLFYVRTYKLDSSPFTTPFFWHRRQGVQLPKISTRWNTKPEVTSHKSMVSSRFSFFFLMNGIFLVRTYFMKVFNKNNFIK